ncbi:UNKNOWN [Stylonychia lemnae]|uniref:Lebercilin domain-containing protein n=1 Tax=Stylonychia lemnae TaxID=5949 RepID=A0A078A0A4_STYLE|nr:UNKNOWN [Stylonychia lemnae]|eukprot:CDW75626.1 UNKNOWN [Stylonychia lemnae]
MAFDGRAKLLDRRNMVRKTGSGSVSSALRSSHISNNNKSLKESLDVTPSNYGNLKDNMNFDSHNNHISVTGDFIEEVKLKIPSKQSTQNDQLHLSQPSEYSPSSPSKFIDMRTYQQLIKSSTKNSPVNLKRKSKGHSFQETDQFNKTYTYLLKLVNDKKSESKKKLRILPKKSQPKFQALTQEEIKLNKKINKLQVQNDMLRQKLKQISKDIDVLLQDNVFLKATISQKQKERESKQIKKNYQTQLDTQTKVGEKMLDQLLHERARIQIRLEQLSNPNYLSDLIKKNEEAEVKINEEKMLKKKLNNLQKTNGEDLIKFQQHTQEQHLKFDRHIKQMGEELQRTILRINEKEKELQAIEEKEMGFIIKQTQVKQRYEDLKKIGDLNNSPIHQKRESQIYLADQTGGEGDHYQEMQALYKKLLVEKWAIQSKTQAQQNEIKLNDKAIRTLEDQIKEKSQNLKITILAIKEMQQQMYILHDTAQSVDIYAKKYGFLTSQSFEKSTPKNNAPRSYDGRSSSVGILSSIQEKQELYRVGIMSKQPSGQNLTINNSKYKLLPPLLSKGKKSSHSMSKIRLSSKFIKSEMKNKRYLNQIDSSDRNNTPKQIQQSNHGDIREQQLYSSRSKAEDFLFKSETNSQMGDQKQPNLGNRSFQLSEIIPDKQDQSVMEGNSILGEEY